MTGHLVRERRHTLHFLDQIRAFAPVYLDTEVDMSRVRAARAAPPAHSYVTYLLYTASRVLFAHPDANAAIRGRVRPRIARYESVNGKVAFDKEVNGRRVVLTAVLPDLQTSTMDEIQEAVDYFRRGDPHTLPDFSGARSLHRLPWPLGAALYRAGARPLRLRPRLFGTFAVSSLGHRPVDGFHSVGGTTVTLGMGRVTERPVVKDGQIKVAPTMRLSLTFDHRVIDGAEAADILGDIKDELETLPLPVLPTALAVRAPEPMRNERRRGA